MQRALILLVVTFGPAACTKGGSFMSVFGGGKPPKPDGDGLLSAEAGSLPKLSRVDLADQLKGIAVMPSAAGENGKGEPGGDYLLCAAEQTMADTARVDGETLEVSYEANADACPSALPTKADTALAGGTGFVTFTYALACKGAAAGLVLKGFKAAAFFRHQSFNFDGAAEKRCLDAAAGKGGYRLKTVKSYGYDVKDMGRNKVTGRVEVKTSLEASTPDQGFCAVEREPGGAITVKHCVYRSAVRLENHPEGGAPSTLEAVTVATAHDLRSKPGDRYYSSGTMDLVINNWRGRAEFRNGAEPPVAELSDGREVLKFKMNGEFTDEAR